MCAVEVGTAYVIRRFLTAHRANVVDRFDRKAHLHALCTVAGRRSENATRDAAKMGQEALDIFFSRSEMPKTTLQAMALKPKAALKQKLAEAPAKGTVNNLSGADVRIQSGIAVIGPKTMPYPRARAACAV